MRDKELCLEILRQIEEASAKIILRFDSIHQVSDFTDSPAGIEKMDAICRNVPEFTSPSWHGGILKKREESLKQGKDEFEDWEKAKKDIWNAVS